MDAFRFEDPQGGEDGVTWFIALQTIEPELQWQDLREIVADVLLFGDGQDYKIGDFVVLPDRIEALVGMYPLRDITDLCRDWIDRSTKQIHTIRQSSGKFWRSDFTTQRVLDWDDFDTRRKSIRRTPRLAKLRVGEYYLHHHDDE